VAVPRASLIACAPLRSGVAERHRGRDDGDCCNDFLHFVFPRAVVVLVPLHAIRDEQPLNPSPAGAGFDLMEPFETHFVTVAEGHVMKERATAIWTQLRPILLMLIVVSSLRSALADWNDVPSGSMRPTILEGDRVVVNKLAYDLKVPFTTIHLAQWSNPSRGDIVVFYSPVDGVRLVKRVIGLPGDVVELRNEQVWINGNEVSWAMDDVPMPDDVQQGGRSFVVEERLGAKQHHVMITPDLQAMRDYGPVTVPAGHYFVMGDNRDNSNDSRYIGPIDRNLIVGRATAVAFSLDRAHYYRPRLDRFFTALR
jgi:signal peptidase I